MHKRVAMRWVQRTSNESCPHCLRFGPSLQTSSGAKKTQRLTPSTRNIQKLLENESMCRSLTTPALPTNRLGHASRYLLSRPREDGAMQGQW